MIPDSIRFKKEASRCEVAAKIAEFLEGSVCADCYNFVLPNLLYFQDEIALTELRDNPRWLALESQFQAVRGLIVEDWEDDEYEPLPSPKIQLEPFPIASQPNNKSRVVGLIVCLIIPAMIGGIWGWFNPPHPPPTQTSTQPR